MTAEALVTRTSIGVNLTCCLHGAEPSSKTSFTKLINIKMVNIQYMYTVCICVAVLDRFLDIQLCSSFLSLCSRHCTSDLLLKAGLILGMCKSHTHC